MEPALAALEQEALSKAQAWQAAEASHVEALREALARRQAQVTALQARYQRLREDFVYNLQLLEQRDAQLDQLLQADASRQELLDARDRSLADLRLQLETAAEALAAATERAAAERQRHEAAMRKEKASHSMSSGLALSSSRPPVRRWSRTTSNRSREFSNFLLNAPFCFGPCLTHDGYCVPYPLYTQAEAEERLRQALAEARTTRAQLEQNLRTVETQRQDAVLALEQERHNQKLIGEKMAEEATAELRAQLHAAQDTNVEAAVHLAQARQELEQAVERGAAARRLQQEAEVTAAHAAAEARTLRRELQERMHQHELRYNRDMCGHQLSDGLFVFQNSNF